MKIMELMNNIRLVKDNLKKKRKKDRIKMIWRKKIKIYITRRRKIKEIKGQWKKLIQQ